MVQDLLVFGRGTRWDRVTRQPNIRQICGTTPSLQIDRTGSSHFAAVFSPSSPSRDCCANPPRGGGHEVHGGANLNCEEASRIHEEEQWRPSIRALPGETNKIAVVGGNEIGCRRRQLHPWHAPVTRPQDAGRELAAAGSELIAS